MVVLFVTLSPYHKRMKPAQYRHQQQAGGVASFAGEGSPFNKVAGLGFGGMPDAAALGEIERAFADRGSPVQVELANLADPEIGAFLTGRGYRLISFENVLGRALTGGVERVMPPGIAVRPSGDDELETWLDVAPGFRPALHPRRSGQAALRRESAAPLRSGRISASG
jgi:hypothetical protein